MPRHLISDALEWINENPSVPILTPLLVRGRLCFASRRIAQKYLLLVVKGD